MKTAACPICDAIAEEREFSEALEQNGKRNLVERLKQYVCGKCETVFTDDDQSRHNLVRTQLAAGEHPRYVLPGQIKRWRGEIGLTQRDAARLLGGGLNAFSKYENGEVTQSDAMDNLLWLAMKYPGLLLDLAKRRGLHLSAKVRDRCGYVFQFSNSQGSMSFDFVTQSQTGDAALAALTVWDQYLALSAETVERWQHSSVIGAANETSFIYGEREARAA